MIDYRKTEMEIKLDEYIKINEFSKVVSRFEEDIDIISGRYILDAKSIMALFSLDLSKPVKVAIHTDNEESFKAFESEMQRFRDYQ